MKKLLFLFAFLLIGLAFSPPPDEVQIDDETSIVQADQDFQAVTIADEQVLSDVIAVSAPIDATERKATQIVQKPPCRAISLLDSPITNSGPPDRHT